MQTTGYRRANFVLLAAIIVINSYIVVAPVLPNVTFWWHHRRSGGVEQLLTDEINAANQAKANAEDPPATKPNAALPFQANMAHNGLIIPRLSLDTPILEASTKDKLQALHNGAWRSPDASSPDQTGNTVIIGNRFTYQQPDGIFYFLDQIRPGDPIGVWYKGQFYTYVVTSTKVVPVADSSTKKQTSDSRLTLYTYTPLLHPTQRLVVVATMKDN